MRTKRQQAEYDRLKKFRILEVDPHPDKTGVLLSDEIAFYALHHQLICPFKLENLKPAAYELTVGNEVMVGGEFLSLGDGPEDNVLCLPPFDVAVIKTGETLNLPRFLIGRWNIRTIWAYRGLIWVGGPQVDPGYVGHLFCPIYNMSSEIVRIRKGEAIAVFDFVKTTPFDPSRGEKEWERYKRPHKRLVIEDFGIDDFHSGPFKTKNELDEINQKMNLFTSLVFGILAILMTAVALPYFSSPERIQPHFPPLDALTLGLSLLAVILSFFNWRARLLLKINTLARNWSARRRLSIITWVFLAIIISMISIVVALCFDLLPCPFCSVPWIL